MNARFDLKFTHHVAQHHPTGSETTPPNAPQSSRFGSKPPSVEDDVDVWRYAILELHVRNDDDDITTSYCHLTGNNKDPLLNSSLLLTINVKNCGLYTS